MTLVARGLASLGRTLQAKRHRVARSPLWWQRSAAACQGRRSTGPQLHRRLHRGRAAGPEGLSGAHPGFELQAGDTAVVVGTTAGVWALAELLDG